MFARLSRIIKICSSIKFAYPVCIFLLCRNKYNTFIKEVTGRLDRGYKFNGDSVIQFLYNLSIIIQFNVVLYIKTSIPKL